MDIVVQGRYEIQDREVFQKEMQEIRNTYQEELRVRDEQINKLNMILEGDISTPEFIRVKKTDLPVEIQTAAELYEYSFMIE